MNYKNKICLDCNLSFKPKSSINVYCDDCYKERCKQMCEFCGTTFYKPAPSATRKSCGSKECVVKAREKSHFEHTGFKQPLSNPNIRKKIEENYIEKTGFKNPSQNPEVARKRREKYFQKTGYYHQSQNPEVLNKIKTSSENKFGIDNYKRLHFKNKELFSREKIIEIFNIENNFISFSLRNKIAEFFGIKGGKTGLTTLRTLGFNVETQRGNSFGEIKLREILIKKGVPEEITIYNDRSVVKSAFKGMMELDVFIPSLNIAIEFNGRYRHPDKEYYSGLNKEDWKTLQCKKSNIKLYHIWDDENIEYRINSIKEIKDFIKRGENG